MLPLDQWRETLDVVADAYDRYRPGYPPELPDDVAFLARLREDGRVLEIGCGAGQATILFAPRGNPLLALEPGAHLAEFARRRCAAYSNVRVAVSTLEHWTPEAEPFDLIFVAQAFHLLDPVHRFSLVAELLGPRGALAVFWNYRLPGDSAAHRALEEAYARYAGGRSSHQLDQDTLFEDDIDRSGRFEGVFMRRYRWTQRYSADDYVGLLESHANLHVLPERPALMNAVHAGIERDGGQIAIDYLTRLYVARRREA